MKLKRGVQLEVKMTQNIQFIDQRHKADVRWKFFYKH